VPLIETDTGGKVGGKKSDREAEGSREQQPLDNNSSKCHNCRYGKGGRKHFNSR